MDIPVEVVLLHPAAKLPAYSHQGPFGDLAADLSCVENFVLAPGETRVIPTGLSMGFPAEYGALIEDRSGLAANKSVTTLAGVVDPGYRGEIKVVLHNLSKDKTHPFRAGERIAQMRLVRRLTATFQPVETLSDTVRGEGGFGSTGV